MFTTRLNEINWDQEAPIISTASDMDKKILEVLEDALGHEVNNGRKDGQLFRRPDFLAPEFESQVTQTHQHVMIINDMGFGKTMFSRYLFESQFSEDIELIPDKLRVYINLKDMMKKVKGENELLSILTEYLLAKYRIKKQLERKAGKSTNKEVSIGILSLLDKLHFLFDGLDECTEEDQYRFVNALAKYKQHIAFILTSRDIPIIQKIRDLDTTNLIDKTSLAETPSEKIDQLLSNFVETRSSKGKLKVKFKTLIATPLFYKEFKAIGAHEFKGSADSFVLKPSLADFYLILLRASLKAKKTSFKTYKEFVDKLFATTPDSNEHINDIRAAAEFCYQDMCSKSRAPALDSDKDYIKALIEIGWCHKSEGQVEWKHLSYKEFLAALHIAKIMQNKASLELSLFVGELKHDWKIYEFTTGILVGHAMQHPESNFIKTDLAAQLNYLLAECDDDEIKKIKIILEDLAEDDALIKDKREVYKQMIESLYFDAPSVKKPLRKILTPFYWNNMALLIDLMVNPDPKRSKELTEKKIGLLLNKSGENEPELTKWIKDIWSLDEIKEKFDLKVEEPVPGSGRIDLYLSPKAGSGIDTLILLEFKKSTTDKDIDSLLNKAINQALVGRNSAEGIAQTMETSTDPETVYEEVCLGNSAYQSGYINAIKIASHVKNIIVIGGVYIVTPKKGKAAADGTPKQLVTDVRFKVFDRIISVDNLKLNREIFENLHNKMLLLKREIFSHASSGFSSGIHVKLATSMLDHLLGEIEHYKAKLTTVSHEEEDTSDVVQAPAAKRRRVQSASDDDDNIDMLSTEADDRTRKIPIASGTAIPAHKSLEAALDLESSEISSRKHTKSPDIIKINFDGTAYDINCSYEYEDKDITAILNARIREYNGRIGDVAIYPLAAVDTIFPDQLYERLTADRAEYTSKRIILIPCNIGNYHWVGLLFAFDESNNCIRAEFINSTNSSVPLTLERQLQAVYADMKFKERFDLITQDDGTSCGACTIENLVLSMTDEKRPTRVNMTLIRAMHLESLKNDQNWIGISGTEIAARKHFFKMFNQRQRLNQRTFDSTQFTSFKKSAYMSESEVLAIAVISSLILNMNEDVRDRITTALALDSNHKAVLDGLRNVLWENIEDEKVQELSMKIFGVIKDSDTDTRKKYIEKSSLLFEYEYLKSIHKLTASGQEEIASIREKIKETPSKTSAKLNTRNHVHYHFTALTVLPDGRLLASSSKDTIHLWNVETGDCEAILRGHTKEVTSIAAHPDGKLISGSRDKTIRVWDVKSAECVKVLNEHEAIVWSVIVLPDSRLASASSDTTIRIWNMDTMKCVSTLKGHKSAVQSLVLLPDGRLVSGSNDRTIRIWNVKTGECEQTLTKSGVTPGWLAVLPDGGIASGQYEIRIWKVQENNCTVFKKLFEFSSLAALPDGRLAVSASKENKIHILNVDSSLCDFVLEGHKSTVGSLVVLPDGRLVSDSNDGTIRIWNVKTGVCELVIPKDAPKKAEQVAQTLLASPDTVAMVTVKEREKKTESHSDSAKEAMVFSGHKRPRSEMSNSMTHATALPDEAAQSASKT